MLLLSTIFLPIFRPSYCTSKIPIYCLKSLRGNNKNLRVLSLHCFFRTQQFLNVIKNLHVAISSTNKINEFRIPFCLLKKFLDKEGNLSLQNAAENTCERSKKGTEWNIRSIFPEEFKNIKTRKNMAFEFRDVENSFAMANKAVQPRWNFRPQAVSLYKRQHNWQ